MERSIEMREKKKIEVKNFTSNNIMDIVKKLKSKNQYKSSSMDGERKNKEILIYDNEFFNSINNQNISKIKQKPKKNCIFL